MWAKASTKRPCTLQWFSCVSSYSVWLRATLHRPLVCLQYCVAAHYMGANLNWRGGVDGGTTGHLRSRFTCCQCGPLLHLPFRWQRSRLTSVPCYLLLPVWHLCTYPLSRVHLLGLTGRYAVATHNTTIASKQAGMRLSCPCSMHAICRYGSILASHQVTTL